MSKITFILLISLVLSACAGLPVSTPTPEPLGTPTSPSKVACSPPAKWSIQFNRSGGFAGLDESLILDSGGSLEVQSERPPKVVEMKVSQDQVDAITDLLVQACPFVIDLTKGNDCADCFVYDLNVQMDGQTYSVQATDVTLTKELNPLIDGLSQLMQNSEQ